MRKDMVCSLSWEDPGEVNGNRLSILEWEIPWTEDPSMTRVHRVTKESDFDSATKQQTKTTAEIIRK